MTTDKTETQEKEQGAPWDTEEFTSLGRFQLHEAYLDILHKCGFMANVARQVRMQPTTRKSMTAGVRYDLTRDEFVLEYSNAFMHWMQKQHGLAGPVFIMFHELDHLVLGHVVERIRQPGQPWNIATDAVIDNMAKQSGFVVPGWVVLPGRLRTMPDGSAISDPRSLMVEKVVESWDPAKDASAEMYFADLLDKAGEAFNSEGAVIFMPGEGMPGSHNWNIPMISDDEGNDVTNGMGPGPEYKDGKFDMEDLREILREKAREIVEKAVHSSDLSNSWGSMPADLQQQIRRSVSKIVDWKTLLKQFIGRAVRGSRTTSIKRINRKYPMIHPGVKRGYVAKVVAFIDQSGSVDNDAIEKFFGELENLARLVEFDVYPFDTRVMEEHRISWRKGMPAPQQRVYCGGTDFDAPTTWANDPANRGRWDAMIILTDGLAPKPASSRVRRAWVIAPKCKLHFDDVDTNDIVIEMDNEGKKQFGAWK